MSAGISGENSVGSMLQQCSVGGGCIRLFLFVRARYGKRSFTRCNNCSISGWSRISFSCGCRRITCRIFSCAFPAPRACGFLSSTSCSGCALRHEERSACVAGLLDEGSCCACRAVGPSPHEGITQFQPIPACRTSTSSSCVCNTSQRRHFRPTPKGASGSASSPQPISPVMTTKPSDSHDVVHVGLARL